MTDSDKGELIKQVERAWLVAERDASLSVTNYLRHVVINSQPPRPFREVAEPWQWALASRIIPAVEYAANVRKQYSGPRRFWLTLPKGHDKTTLIARLLNWAMAFNKTSLSAYAAAKDRDQAALIVDAMMTEVNLNPWMKKRVDFKNWKVLGVNHSRLHVLATDAGGNQGIRGDLVIVDELSQWNDQEFFRTLISGIAKRPRGILVIITNAGVQESWQWDVLQEAQKLMAETGLWYVYQAPHSLATWMNEADRDQDRRMMPTVMAQMLYDNVWAPARHGSEYVTREQARACEDPQAPLLEPGSSTPCWLAIDYGPVKDRTTLARLHREGDVVVVDELQVWQGSKEHHVPIANIEAWLDEQRKNYHIETTVVDKFQLEQLIQKYTGLVNIEVFEPRGGNGNHAIAENLRSLIVNQKIKWRPGCGALLITDKNGNIRTETFTDELATVAVKVMPTGYRVFNTPKNHDDRFCAVAMAALWAVRQPRKRDLWLGDGNHWF